MRIVGAIATVGALLLAPAAHAAEAPTRYSLANGCYTVSGTSLQGAEHVRLQATGLGRYLLYRPDGTFVAAQGAPASAPSPATEFVVEDAGGGAFKLTPASGGGAQTGTFAATDGCAVYPEADLDATGRPGPAPTSFQTVGGLVEGHMHWMTFEYLGGRFHCGRPWHPYGIPSALPDCADIEGPQGTAAPMQNFLNYGNPAQPHDTKGWPTLKEWAPGNLTYEGTYWRWIERAYLGGLRLMVMGVNENRILCELQANRTTNCNEMDTMRRGFKAIRDLQDYVDAQAGGPGKGFFQIVTDPYQARQVINQGRMAVVLEIETSEPFDCAGWDQPTCNQEQVDREFDEMYKLGVRSMLLLNKVDNPLTGVRFDSGPVGVLINGANKLSAGSYWSAQTCQGPLRDNEIYQPEPQSAAALASLQAQAGLPSGATPTYPPAPHCNTRGLTDLGKHVVERMMDRHMIVNPDHMSQAAVSDTLSLLEARRYSGVISPHGWMDPGNWPRLWKLGGIAFPGHSAADDYVKEWQRYRPLHTPYKFGWGYGADLGGLSHQPDKTNDGKSITYPFKSYDGKVTFERQKTGERTFDYTKDGVANYGLYADWFEDLRQRGGDQLARDMWHGAEAYIEMWERADGIPARGCNASRGPLARSGFGELRLGLGWKALLRRAGQPEQRTTRWTWCVRGKRNKGVADVALLSKAGRVQLVGSSAHGRRAHGVRVGAPLARVRAVRGQRYAGGGTHYLRTRRGAWVWAVRGGRVRGVGVPSRALAKRPHALRLAARRLRSARAQQLDRTFVNNPVQASAKPRNAPLAGTRDARLNSALTLLCSLQVQAPSAR